MLLDGFDGEHHQGNVVCGGEVRRKQDEIHPGL